MIRLLRNSLCLNGFVNVGRFRSFKLIGEVLSSVMTRNLMRQSGRLPKAGGSSEPMSTISRLRDTTPMT
jgi:hypothetical protein